MTEIHAKVKAGGVVASVVTVLVAGAAIFNVDIDVSTQNALLIIGAAASPVVAGYAKRA